MQMGMLDTWPLTYRILLARIIALLARSQGDFIALEAKYHLTCLVALRNCHHSQMRKTQGYSEAQGEEKKIQARSFIGLMNYIENAVEDGVFHFKFSELQQLNEKRLQDLGVKKKTNKVHFKEQILEYFPLAQVQCDGKNVVLVFQQGLQQMLKQSLKFDYEGLLLFLQKVQK